MGPILGGVPIIRYSAAGSNIVFDGNSLVEATHVPAGKGIVPQLMPLPPLNSQVSITNIGKNGQTINDMRARGSAYADASYVAGKKNILIAWEATNSICNTGFTGAVAGAQMEAYCAERLAAHPDWVIVLMTTIPRFATGAYAVPTGNAELNSYDAYIKENFKRMGAKKIIDVRASGIFTYTGPTVSAEMAPYMLEEIHYNAAGGALLAQYVADGIKRLPAR